MTEFFDKSSPFAYQDMTARMLETVRKGYWKADAATEKKLLEEYVASVNQHGVGCAEHTCGNPRLQQYVMERGLRPAFRSPISRASSARWRRRRARPSIRPPSARRRSAARTTRRWPRGSQRCPRRAARRGSSKGYLMEERDRSHAGRKTRRDRTHRRTSTPRSWPHFPCLAFSLAWRWRGGSPVMRDAEFRMQELGGCGVCILHSAF